MACCLRLRVAAAIESERCLLRSFAKLHVGMVVERLMGTALSIACSTCYKLCYATYGSLVGRELHKGPTHTNVQHIVCPCTA